MRILIYAPAARMGGARAHVLGLLPELASIAPSDEVLVLAQPDLISELAPLPLTWNIRAERADRRSFVGRLIWEQRVLPRIAARWGADALLSFGSFVPLRSTCPSVLEAGNALPFTRAYWRVLEHQPLRLQAQERARCGQRYRRPPPNDPGCKPDQDRPIRDRLRNSECRPRREDCSLPRPSPQTLRSNDPAAGPDRGLPKVHREAWQPRQ